MTIPASCRAPRPRTDGEPHRAVSSVNVRKEDKDVFDLVQTWWSIHAGRPLSHWDVFSVLLSSALADDALDLPPGVRPRRAAAPRALSRRASGRGARGSGSR